MTCVGRGGVLHLEAQWMNLIVILQLVKVTFFSAWYCYSSYSRDDISNSSLDQSQRSWSSAMSSEQRPTYLERRLDKDSNEKRTKKKGGLKIKGLQKYREYSGSEDEDFSPAKRRLIKKEQIESTISPFQPYQKPKVKKKFKLRQAPPAFKNDDMEM